MQTFARKHKGQGQVFRKTSAPSYYNGCDSQQAAIRRILRSAMAQAKLIVGAADDVYELGTDRAAQAVVRMPEGSLNRQPLEEDLLPTQADGGRTPEVTPRVAAAIEAMQGGGHPLPTAEREFFEPRFGYDFSQVRIHSGALAAETARAINAEAFTVGRDVVLGGNDYASEPGLTRRLLAHELAHVVQQQGDGRTPAGGALLQRTERTPWRYSYETEEEALAWYNKIIELGVKAEEPTQTGEAWTFYYYPLTEEEAEAKKIAKEKTVSDDYRVTVERNPTANTYYVKTALGRCPAGYTDLGQFTLTAYVLAQEKEFPQTPTVTDPCGLTGTFRNAFLYQTNTHPRGVKMQGSGRSLAGQIIHYTQRNGADCFETLECPKTKSLTCAQSGRTVAVDPSVIALNTELFIEDVGKRVAEDVGGGIKGNHIDVYYGTDLTMDEALKKTMQDKKVCKKDPQEDLP